MHDVTYFQRKVNEFRDDVITPYGKEQLVSIALDYGYTREEFNEMVIDALWYSDDNFYRLHPLKKYRHKANKYR